MNRSKIGLITTNFNGTTWHCLFFIAITATMVGVFYCFRNLVICTRSGSFFLRVSCN